MKHSVPTFHAVFVAIAVTALAWGCSKNQAPVAKPVATAAAPKPAAAPSIAVDGDAHAPFAVKTNLSGAIEPGVAHPLVLEIQALADVDELTTAVRGIDGVQAGDERGTKHPAVATNRSVRHEGTVEVASGVAGTLAIDIAWRRGNESHSTTLAVDIHAIGATKKTPPLGRIERASDGTQVQILPAEQR